jgi:hypothetical protein
METNKKRLAQDIDIDNNPVNKDIIPENKDITEEETPTTPIEQINNNKMRIDPKPPTPETGNDNVVDLPRTNKADRNPVRYVDSGFRF